MRNGFFGDIFDYNDDGELTGFERAMDTAMFAMMMDDMEEEERKADLYDRYGYMDDCERRRAMEEDGLDPDDYDF